ncbi:hypothetical protein ADUPG1_009313, partial [Aduncisulcus paluster]
MEPETAGEYPYKPEINPISQILDRKNYVESIMDWDEERKDKIEERIEQFRKIEVQELQDHPTINSKSLKLAERSRQRKLASLIEELQKTPSKSTEISSQLASFHDAPMRLYTDAAERQR